MVFDNASIAAATASVGKKKPIWYPTESYINGSRLADVMGALGIAHRLDNAAEAYSQLLNLSTRDPESFWRATLDSIGFEWFSPYERTVDLSEGLPWPKWFPGGHLNLAHNALDRHLNGTRARKTALIWEGEDGTTVRLTYSEVSARVAQAANALRELGIRRGDRIGIYLPMLPETAISALAIARIGAILIPIFSGYGTEAVAVRLRDAEARVLITADAFHRRGALVPMLDYAREACRLAPSIERIIVVNRIGRASLATGEISWSDLVERQSTNATTEAMDSMEPCMLVYTSGTTGRPKGTVHYHAGFPIKASQDMAHLFDLREHETMFWFTDMGWMMGPWLIVGALTLGATALLYEGAPDYPGPDRIWDLLERHHATHLGLSPTLVRSLVGHGVGPVKQHDLSSLRVLGSTGELWTPEAYDWLFENVGNRRLPIINYSGGTEIAGGIIGCCVFRPIKKCGFNTVAPGINAVVIDENGRPVLDKVGELAVTNVWPGMTNGFWKDPERYLETYWNRFPGIWVHGDWALVDSEGHWLLFGRSDDTLKIAGKRVGPAEIEAAAQRYEIREAAAIGVPDPTKGEVPVLFVVLMPGVEPSDRLATEIADYVALSLGKPLRPRQVHFVSELPKTRNAKIMRRVIRAVYLGREPGDLSALENPGSLKSIPRVQ